MNNVLYEKSECKNLHISILWAIHIQFSIELKVIINMTGFMNYLPNFYVKLNVMFLRM